MKAAEDEVLMNVTPPRIRKGDRIILPRGEDLWARTVDGTEYDRDVPHWVIRLIDGGRLISEATEEWTVLRKEGEPT